MNSLFKILSTIPVIILLYTAGYLKGKADIKDNTKVIDIYENTNSFVSKAYFGKCLIIEAKHLCATTN